MASETAKPGAKFMAIAAALLLVANATCRATDGALPGDTNPLPDGYSLSYDRSKWTNDFSVFHMSAAEPFGVIGSSMAASDDPRLRPLTRLDTTWNFAAPIVRAPARLGDTVSSSAFWDDPVRIGGLQFGTYQPVIPDVIAPPSVVVPDFASIPSTAAIQSSRIIDHVHSISQLQKQSLVSAGQADYSVEMGRVREDFELRSNNYGMWLTSGTYRYGVSAATTVDGQFAQLGAQQSVFGVGVLEGLGPLGMISARVANSRDVDSSGWLARMGYDYSKDSVSFALRSHIQSAGFQTVGDITAVEPLRQRTLASAGIDFGRLGMVSVASATQTLWDDSRRDVVALSHAMALAGGGILSTAAAYSPGQFASSALLLSFTYPFDYWSSPGRTLGKMVDLSLDRTIVDAFNQTRLPMSGRLFTDHLPVQ